MIRTVGVEAMGAEPRFRVLATACFYRVTACQLHKRVNFRSPDIKYYNYEVTKLSDEMIGQLIHAFNG